MDSLKYEYNADVFETLNALFKSVINQLNDRKNNFDEIREIIFSNEEIIKNTILFLRNYKDSVKFNPEIHDVDQRYVEFLKEKKIGKYFVPAYVLGDGNCLFRAVSQVMLGTQVFHKILRICTVFVLIRHINFFKTNSTWNKKQIEQHITRISRDKVFGGEDDQMALSFIFRKPILVICYTKTSPFTNHNRVGLSLEFNAIGGIRCDPIFIVFDFEGEHFTSVLMRNDVEFNFDGIRPKNSVITERMEDIL